MKQYDVMIIGAGPSGIFCAYELIHAKKNLKILMIEKGRRIEKRECPKRKTKVCVGCKPCSITTGFAGAGAFVPLTGFGYNLWKGIKDAVNEDGFLGLFRGGFKMAAVGTSAALIFSYFASLIFSPKMPKN